MAMSEAVRNEFDRRYAVRDKLLARALVKFMGDRLTTEHYKRRVMKINTWTLDVKGFEL